MTEPGTGFHWWFQYWFQCKIQFRSGRSLLIILHFKSCNDHQIHEFIDTNFLICINQCAGKRTFATPKPNPNHPKPSFFQKKAFKSPKNSKNRVCLQWTLYQLVTNRPKSRFSAAKKVGFLIKYKLELIKIVSWPAYEPTLKRTSS